MKPTIKTTREIRIAPTAMCASPTFREKYYERKWLLVDEEITWLEDILSSDWDEWKVHSCRKRLAQLKEARSNYRKCNI